MSSIGKILGLGVAGFGVYLVGSNLGWWGTSAAPAPAPAPAGSPGPAPVAPAPMSADQQTALIAALKAAGTVCASPSDSAAACVDPVYSGSQWNWYMQNKTNPGSTPAQLPTGDTTMDAAAYVAARVAAGFGLGAFRPINYVPRRFA